MSGVQGIAPRWPSCRARFLFREINERGYDLPLASVTRDGGVEFRADLDISVWNPGGDVSGYKRVIPGDFVIGLRSFQSGLGCSPLEGLVSPAYSVLRPRREDMHAGYFRHLLKSDVLVSLLENIAQGIRQGRTIAVEDFNELRLPVPPPSTQRVIADYLDHETARVDALIAAKRRMVELLEERFEDLRETAFNSLDAPSVRLGRFVTSIGQGVSPEAEARPIEGDEWGVLKLSAVKHGCFIPSEHKALPAGYHFDPELVPRSGDLLVTRANTPELVGDVCAVRTPAPHLMLCDLIYRLRLSRDLDSEYAAQALLTRSARRQLSSLARGTSQSMVKLRGEDVKNTVLPVPPVEAQRSLVGKLSVASARIDAVNSDLRRSIRLLREHRQALITAAVTGELDVPRAG